MAAMSAVPLRAHAADAPARAHVLVAMCASAHVPSDILDKATRIVDAVYRDAGVVLEWTDDCGAGARVLEVHLVAHDATDGTISTITLGFAEPESTVATVLYDRVEFFAQRYRVRREVLLGYGIAHEIGHLLLPPHSHSDTGVMRSTLDLELASAKRLRFTRPQAEMIVRRLEGSTVAVATH
jgi:predicted Zn-dependent protease